MVYLVAVAWLFAGCSGQADVTASDPPPATPRPTLAPLPTTPAQAGPGELDPEPAPFIPAGRPGDAGAYAGLVAKLEHVVPHELRAQVPWPDLRNPNPIIAQIEIFELWIWMAANLTEPQLAEVMAAPGSPSRESVVSVFGDLQTLNIFEIRTGQPYEAFDHLVVTFASAGLPLWLSRDVPVDAVVVYYSDKSGPVDIVDQISGATIMNQPSVATRAWLSIMVPTDVGWQLWRDQLIEPNDAELKTPDLPPPPGADIELRPPEL